MRCSLSDSFYGATNSTLNSCNVVLHCSFGMAHSFVDSIGDVDVISDAEVNIIVCISFEMFYCKLIQLCQIFCLYSQVNYFIADL